MIRKAKAGHVTGGRVFGYDNVRTDKGHVERVINSDEAVVVRRIFDLCVKGFGQVAIAKKLNDQGAVSPRAQQGRLKSWASSSVREVLYRDLYRGELVWNRTKKRDQWGKVDPEVRPESDWLRVPVPKLRIVSDDLWTKAHQRLATTRESYLRATGGRLWGRPMDGRAAKYLLTGLARCGCCGGSLEVRSGTSGKSRAYFYACSSYWRRGKAVCRNKALIPLTVTDDAVISALGDELLTPAFVDLVVSKVLTRTVPAGAALDEARADLQQQLADVSTALENLVEGLARSGVSPSLTTAIKKREAMKSHVESQLASLDQQDHVSHVEKDRLAALARTKASEWRALLVVTPRRPDRSWRRCCGTS